MAYMVFAVVTDSYTSYCFIRHVLLQLYVGLYPIILMDVVSVITAAHVELFMVSLYGMEN